MALELKQSLKLSQKLVMTPQLRQAIKLLQLGRLELTDALQAEIEQNPMLEEIPPPLELPDNPDSLSAPKKTRHPGRSPGNRPGQGRRSRPPSPKSTGRIMPILLTLIFLFP
jgi:DNA-directed RNA polymerase specialized sigma54-like protein